MWLLGSIPKLSVSSFLVNGYRMIQPPRSHILVVSSTILFGHKVRNWGREVEFLSQNKTDSAQRLRVLTPSPLPKCETVLLSLLAFVTAFTHLMYKYHMLLWNRMDSKFSNRIRQKLKSNFACYLNVWWILKPLLL